MSRSDLKIQMWSVGAAKIACGYREFRPYLRQHPCGTLIEDLLDAHWFPCWQAHRSLKTGRVCLVQLSSAFKCRELVSRKNPLLDQQKFGRVGEAVPPRKPNTDATGLFRLSSEALELIVVATMISRMAGTPVFSDRTEFSVTTGEKCRERNEHR
jgi:hypothetical protein